MSGTISFIKTHRPAETLSIDSMALHTPHATIVKATRSLDALNRGEMEKQWNSRARQTAKSCIHKVERLTKSKRNARVHLTHSSRWRAGFMVTEENKKRYMYSGLTKRLKATFWPHTNDDPRYRLVRKQRKQQHRTCPTWGKKHGDIVHKELELYTKYMIREPDPAAFKRRCPDPDPCTVRVIGVFQKKGWYPILAEHPIFDEDLGIATAIDLLVVDIENHKLIALELKTGYEDGEYDAPALQQPEMAPPLHGVPNSPLQRALVQLVACLMILEKHYRLKVDAAYVMRTCSKDRCTELYGLDTSWCFDKARLEAMYVQLEGARSINSKRRQGGGDEGEGAKRARWAPPTPAHPSPPAAAADDDDGDA